LIEASDGALYGTTRQGGASGQGTAFKINKDGTGFLPLHSFQCGTSNGCFPTAGVIEASDGVLYGTTQQGGGGAGIVYRLVSSDTQPPTINIVTPANGATYTLNQAVPSNYSCTDPSGVSSCSGSVANGSNINTASVGTKSFTVNAKDTLGNSSSATNNYSVKYNFSGFLQPVDNPDVVNTGKAGRTYPVKWQLRDGNNAYISSLSAVTSVTYKSTSCGAFTGDPTNALETTATGGTILRYDSTANQYIYNWATPGTGCYTLFLTLDSGQVFYAYFKLTK
jgi:uncharacterized repeat protein (TIGR03803 family)